MDLSETLKNIDLSKLNSMSPEERALAISILKEYGLEGKSETFQDLLYEDYREIPVDILTFVDDERYLGNAWHDAQGNSKLYPYWRKELVKIFPDNVTTTVNNAIFSGSRGRGKSEICVLIACYLLHRLLCLKNPIEFYHLKSTEKIVFAFMNIKLALANEIATTKFQNTIKSSPWFLAHGTLEGRTNKVWVPEKFKNNNGKEQEAIDIKIGSQADDLIGLPVYFCLDGDTPILTEKGIYKIKDLEGKDIKVPSISEDGSVVLSDSCTVMQTDESDVEYEIELEDGSSIKCTATHRFRLIDGTYKEARHLTESDEIMDFDPYGYVYLLTNKINGKIYIGQHQGKFLDENYFGGGYLINKAVKKYGKENFDKRILEYCRSKQQLDAQEKFYIKKYDARNTKIGYNISEGGQGGNLGETVNKKISNSIKGIPKSAEHKKALSDANKGKTLSNDVRAKISASNKGKTVSKDSRIKMSESAKKLDHSHYKTNKNKISINDGNTTIFINIEDLDSYPGWKRGNLATKGHHDMSNYYSNPNMQKRKSESHKGFLNGMYGKGYLRKGGNNTNATKFYIYKNMRFECRKDLVLYLQQNGFKDISVSTIRNIENNSYKSTTVKRYKDVIDSLSWGYKNED